jgi:succinyl-CoA synthetase beta subunit
MRLLEYEAKQVLQKFGIMVPKGVICKDEEDLTKSLNDIGFPAVLKAQLPIGGRGKKGAIVIVKDPKDALSTFNKMRSGKIDGYVLKEILVEQRIDTDTELYLGMTVDPSLGKPVLIISKTGGIDIEDVPTERIHILELEIEDPLPCQKVDDLLRSHGFEDAIRNKVVVTASSMWSIFTEYECELVEINPLFVSKDMDLIAGDAKVILNDDALYRHPDLGYDIDRWKSDFERRSRTKDLTGIELDGYIGVIANGAGLTMAVLDTLSDHRMTGGAFLDLGGTDDPGRIREAIELMSDRDLLPNVRGILICVFGGVTKCDTVAEGIIGSMKEMNDGCPMVIRLRGVNEDVASDLLHANGIECYTSVRDSCVALAKKLDV